REETKEERECYSVGGWWENHGGIEEGGNNSLSINQPVRYMVDWHVKYNYCSGANAPGQKPIRPSITFGRSTDDANNELTACTFIMRFHLHLAVL
uniref:Uncharacterized protein n=1 Tax=Cynoglossus semilaevis TaxID=244447 RepID=A0A3P8WLA8_CYNSE